jgi:hypothetical protein
MLNKAMYRTNANPNFIFYLGKFIAEDLLVP